MNSIRTSIRPKDKIKEHKNAFCVHTEHFCYSKDAYRNFKNSNFFKKIEIQLYGQWDLSDYHHHDYHHHHLTYRPRHTFQQGMIQCEAFFRLASLSAKVKVWYVCKRYSRSLHSSVGGDPNVDNLGRRGRIHPQDASLENNTSWKCKIKNVKPNSDHITGVITCTTCTANKTTDAWTRCQH